MVMVIDPYATLERKRVRNDESPRRIAEVLTEVLTEGEVETLIARLELLVEAPPSATIEQPASEGTVSLGLEQGVGTSGRPTLSALVGRWAAPRAAGRVEDRPAAG
jgi:hypothetical protein